ncbi:MAG: hypothetical protein EXR51_11395 [Dehalococcoidia bacterium]|nr:hypothetical protein [Dehalococcoidia bacterium]
MSAAAEDGAVIRLPFSLRLAWGFAIVIAGCAVLVWAAMLTVAAQDAQGKAGGIGLAVVAVWVMSRGGLRLYDLLMSR